MGGQERRSILVRDAGDDQLDVNGQEEEVESGRLLQQSTRREEEGACVSNSLTRGKRVLNLIPTVDVLLSD